LDILSLSSSSESNLTTRKIDNANLSIKFATAKTKAETALTTESDVESQRFAIGNLMDGVCDKLYMLLCFKVADLINVCDANGFDLDIISSQVCGGFHNHKEWTAQFLNSFESFYKSEKEICGRAKLAKTLEPLARVLIERAQKR